MNEITMDTVRDLIERHSDHISGNTREFYNGAYAEIADELNSRAERTCRILENFELPYSICSECGAIQPDDFTVYYCWACGAKVRNE